MTINYIKRKTEELINTFPESKEKEMTKLVLNSFIKYLEDTAHDRNNA